MIRQEIIKQYVYSLKEDDELDFIFPMLLERMGYRILSTPRQSKGMSQYGRDVIAVKKLKGVPTLFLFELKGFAAKDITDRTLNEKDGLIESLRASKYTVYEDASIPDLKDYPRMYVFVHNGMVDANAQPTLNGFIKSEFPEGNFERWDLAKLTSLFSTYLFDETLLADDESYRLFKKCLVLLDAEENDMSDLVRLVDLQIAKMDAAKKENRRQMLNLFATLRLIVSMVYFYAQESDNLYPAKYCADTVVLKAWAYMVKSPNTNDLILKIDAGIVKEVSVSCRIEKKVCSICGNQYNGSCNHILGTKYDDRFCYIKLENPTDAYEWSFVAVPAQKEAGVTKRVKKYYKISDSNVSEFQKNTKALEYYKNRLKSNVIKLSYLNNFMTESTCFKDIIEKLTIKELESFLHYFSNKLKEKDFSPSLASLSSKEKNMLKNKDLDFVI